jgi:hypothetical protein
LQGVLLTIVIGFASRKFAIWQVNSFFLTLLIYGFSLTQERISELTRLSSGFNSIAKFRRTQQFANYAFMTFIFWTVSWMFQQPDMSIGLIVMAISELVREFWDEQKKFAAGDRVELEKRVLKQEKVVCRTDQFWLGQPSQSFSTHASVDQLSTADIHDRHRECHNGAQRIILTSSYCGHNHWNMCFPSLYHRCARWSIGSLSK